jgi:sulfate adenylyltransferase
MTSLITPYGGQLTNLIVAEEEQASLRDHANRLPSIQLSIRAAYDLEMLANGAFSPLQGFMGSADYERVLAEMRLANGMLFPIPITLPVDPLDVQLDREVALRNARNELLAVLTIEEAYSWDRQSFAQAVLASTDSRHPLVAELPRWGSINIAGRLRVLQVPQHYDFSALYLTPAQVRAELTRRGNPRVVAFQTRNPLHRAHEELTKRAAQQIDGTLLLHPVVGLTRPGDTDHYTRVRTYRALLEAYYEPNRTLLALLPLAMRMAGPREALWHAIIRKNYGASHFIVGRDHAGPGMNSHGQPFYGPFAAQALVQQHAEELGITPVIFDEMVYVAEQERYEEAKQLPTGTKTMAISGTQVRADYLEQGKLLPQWFTRPEVAAILGESYPPRHQQGVCIWFTGLSGAGKSTTAEILAVLLMEYGRQSTMLDGDVVRTHLSKGLGFSKEDRDANIRRIGFVAAEIARHGGIAICAAVSPYKATRAEVRAMVEADHFVEVFVDTPIEECERRDVKGMYAKARRGEITGFTGVDDPYEPPMAAELTLDTIMQSPEQNAWIVLNYLAERGFVRSAWR